MKKCSSLPISLKAETYPRLDLMFVPRISLSSSLLLSFCKLCRYLLFKNQVALCLYSLACATQKHSEYTGKHFCTLNKSQQDQPCLSFCKVQPWDLSFQQRMKETFLRNRTGKLGMEKLDFNLMSINPIECKIWIKYTIQ